MNIILLSGGSGKRLWPLSNEIRSKQFLKIFTKEDGTHESMVQRIYRMIHEVDNKTLDPVLANNIHTAVVDMFKRNAGGVRLVNDEANADFEITLLSYSNKPENYNSNSDVETYRVTIRVSVKFYDNVKERIIYENKSLSAEGVYDVQKNEAEDRHGQARAIEKLQDLIIANALAKW